MSIAGIMFNCRQFDEFVVSYLEGTLPLTQKIAFRSHLAMCSTCRSYLRRYKRTIALAKASAAATEPLPPPPAELIAAILAAKRDADEKMP